MDPSSQAIVRGPPEPLKQRLGSSRRAHLGHESRRPVGVDGIPGPTVDLEIRADDRTVRDSEEVPDVGRLDPGVREDRGLVTTPLLGLAHGLHGRLRAGHRAGNEDGVGRLDTRTDRAVVAMSRDPTLEANSGVMFMKTATFLAFNSRR